MEAHPAGLGLVLKAAEAPESDVGLGRARVDTKTRMTLSMDIGETIELIGKKSTAAKLFRVTEEDEGKGLIRIDGLIRRNLGVSIGDEVGVRRAKVSPAEWVTIAPIISEGHKISFGHGIEDFIRRGLLKRPVAKGDVVIIPGIALMGGALPFMVMKLTPPGLVEIVEESVVTLRPEPVREETTLPDDVLESVVRALRATLAEFEYAIDDLPDEAGERARKLRVDILRLLEEEERDRASRQG